jgi:hypothetical protein
MKYLWHWLSLLTLALYLNVAQQVTPPAPARRTPSKKGLVLTWVGHLPHPTKEALHGLFDPLTWCFDILFQRITDNGIEYTHLRQQSNMIRDSYIISKPGEEIRPPFIPSRRIAST